MSLNTELKGKTQRPLPPAQQHLGLCYSIVDLGTHMLSFQGKPAEAKPLVQFAWEFPNLPKVVFDKTKGEQPMAVFQEYTFYLGPKANLGKMMNSWIGQEVSKLTPEILQKFKGKPAMIQIVHNTDKKGTVDSKTGKLLIYANVAGIFKRPADVAFPKTTVNPWTFFSLDLFTWDSYNALPKHLQEKISKCLEWRETVAKHGANPLDNTGLPTEEQMIESESTDDISSMEEEMPF